MMQINKVFLEQLREKAEANPRLRMNYDMRTSPDDSSQRMLNVLLPGTEVAVHRHMLSSESVMCLSGKMDEVFYEECYDRDTAVRGQEREQDAGDGCSRTVLREVKRIRLNPSAGDYGCVVPAGVWHTVEVIEPSVIFEAKDGKYGEDGSETYKGSV